MTHALVRRALATTAVLLLAGPAAVAAGVDGTAATGGVVTVDAPRAVRVGAPVVEVPVTVGTDVPVEEVVVSLVDAEDGRQIGLGSAGPAPGSPLVHEAVVPLRADRIGRWGDVTWRVDTCCDDGGEPAAATTTRPAQLRADSRVDITIATRFPHRTTGLLDVHGRLLGYHSVADRYVGLPGRRVSLQRWTGQAWVQVIGSTSNDRGFFISQSPSVDAPVGTSLRVVLVDAPTVWGAVSETVTVVPNP